MQGYDIAFSEQCMQIHMFSVEFLSDFRRRSWITVVDLHSETLAKIHERLTYLACTDDTNFLLE